MAKRKIKTFLSILMLLNIFALVPPTRAIYSPDAGPDQNIYSGQTVTLVGSFDPAYLGGWDLQYKWDFGDGSSIETGSVTDYTVSTTHTYVGSPGDSFTATFSIWVNGMYGEWESDTVQITINYPPVADANGPYSGDEGSSITLDGTGSSDPDDDIVLYEWDLDDDGEYDDATGVIAYNTWGDNGVYTIGLRVTDDNGLTDTDTAEVNVYNVPPTAYAGPDQTVDEGTPVTFDGDYSDPGILDAFLFEWDFDGDGVYDYSSVSSPDTTYIYSVPGAYTATLRVTDDDGGAGTDTAVIIVSDITPPEISVTVTPDTLWPPNHKYVTVTATVIVSDLMDPNPTVTIVSVTSNEPDNGVDDGNTVNDIVIVDDYTFKLRAERSGLGSGRIYTITYQAADKSGNIADAYATVIVPLTK